VCATQKECDHTGFTTAQDGESVNEACNDDRVAVELSAGKHSVVRAAHTVRPSRGRRGGHRGCPACRAAIKRLGSWNRLTPVYGVHGCCIV
jgi:hypothetical protein